MKNLGGIFCSQGHDMRIKWNNALMEVLISLIQKAIYMRKTHFISEPVSRTTKLLLQLDQLYWENRTTASNLNSSHMKRNLQCKFLHAKWPNCKTKVLFHGTELFISFQLFRSLCEFFFCKSVKTETKGHCLWYFCVSKGYFLTLTKICSATEYEPLFSKQLLKLLMKFLGPNLKNYFTKSSFCST